jgi:hypothetical protein
MPRSNKKKFLSKPSQKHQTMDSVSESSSGISSLLKIERNQMISRAFTSGNNHGIQLVPGSPNAGRGDCAFEAVVQNNNDRSCFHEKYPMTMNQYRRIWVTDMANRTIDSPWNTLSQQQWLEGWNQMLIPGTYERGIFGDLMLPGIACGVRKKLLIFNTSTDSPHDPIYVVNPSQFNVQADTEIPIVLAYNLSHYESLHPLKGTDIEATVNLVRDYEEGRYRFRRQDIPALICSKMKTNEDEDMKKHIYERKSAEKQNINQSQDMNSYPRPEATKQQFNENESRVEIDLEGIDDFLDAFHISKSKRHKEDAMAKNVTEPSTSEGTDFNMNPPKQPLKANKRKISNRN